MPSDDVWSADGTQSGTFSYEIGLQIGHMRHGGTRLLLFKRSRSVFYRIAMWGGEHRALTPAELEDALSYLGSEISGHLMATSGVQLVLHPTE